MIEIDWVEIPAGQFQVGCDDWQIFQIRQKLGRAHRSKLDAVLQNLQRRTISSQGFAISRFPITHVQMDEFFKHFPDLSKRRVLPRQDALSSFPEENEWEVSDLFCRWAGGRLPTASRPIKRSSLRSTTIVKSFFRCTEFKSPPWMVRIRTSVFCLQRVNLESGVSMTTITVSISDDRMQKLRERASHYNVAPEELVRVSVDDLLARPEEDFRQAIEYVLKKNSELYQRLA